MIQCCAGQFRGQIIGKFTEKNPSVGFLFVLLSPKPANESGQTC
ncbi:hypothetical protein GCWU000325_02341 [Alloprevotella tannerae ATCC 51259]|uniref:Uncharacterized protein n=1 Tax=Alloprevotella tannerae ATCC 51259 TaxID=626522 RepID=C9LJC8_9BACT|nr:hypothetical protein GCWU000325_02341 [Alloprevotella tannerae ATCC 51259]